MISSPYAVFTSSSVQSMLPATIRNQAIDIADACDFELTYKELIRFLPTSVIQEFNAHMAEVADIEDIVEIGG